MSKQDRQGVRTASDLERKYDFGLIAGKGSGAKGGVEAQIQKLNQTMSQFIALCTGRFEELEHKVDALSLGYIVTFLVDGEVYESCNVKEGNSVNAPAVNPTSEEGTFVSWQHAGENVTFPYTPTEDTELTALFQ